MLAMQLVLILVFLVDLVFSVRRLVIRRGLARRLGSLENNLRLETR
jgi:hypothetical protein